MFCCTVSTQCIYIILECKNLGTTNHYIYNDIVLAAFGTIDKLAVDFIALLCNLGRSASYIILICSNLQVAKAIVKYIALY